MSDPTVSWPSGGTDDRARELIAAFLVMDIQRSLDWARELLGKITDVKSAALPSWQRVGNAYRLRLSAEGALIEDLVEPTNTTQPLPLEELEAAVTAWIEAIS